MELLKSSQAANRICVNKTNMSDTVFTSVIKVDEMYHAVRRRGRQQENASIW
jgi:hypothetical protein